VRTIVFIHGMYLTPLCWEGWIRHFDAKGYATLAPPWPGRHESVPSLNARHPDTGLGRLSFADVVDSFVVELYRLRRKPILIGHSLGGLVAQILLNRGMAAAAVAIGSSAPPGVFSTEWSYLKANWPMVNPFVSELRPRKMDFEDFQHAFVNNLPLDEQRALYERYVVPDSRRVPREAASKVARIDFHREHSPLLFIAGEADIVAPASLSRSNFERYECPKSITDFKAFPRRGHFIIGESGWDEVADYVGAWLKRRLDAP
jgi:pimeloyl-ACP methyl ester carboxylesterase